MESRFAWRNLYTTTIFTMILGLAPCTSSTLLGQENSVLNEAEIAPDQMESIEIADDPKTVDPATLVSAQLAALVTVKLDGEPLKKLFSWLQQEQSLNLLVDYQALAAVKVLETEPVYEELSEAPLYLLLNRLERMGISWYEQDNSLVLTSRPEYLKHDRTSSYHLGDLFDAGYQPADLLNLIRQCSGGRWSGTQEGFTVLLGDVVFIRQQDDTHREIAGLLSALRKHGRRTFTMDSPGQEKLRTALEQKLTVDFQETPLVIAVQEISRLAQIPIRLDRIAMTAGTVRERAPVTLTLTEQKLGSVLGSLLSNLGLSWSLRDEVLWITSYESANKNHKTAVFDVRDLCSDSQESMALKKAIETQTRASWKTQDDRAGSLEVPKPGVLVARHTESVLDEVLQLLENYRIALKASKFRPEKTLDPAELVTGYYRLTESMAMDLSRLLPDLILPGTWSSEQNRGGPGTIRLIAAESGTADVKQNPTPYAVLVIRQTRAAHQSIGKLISSLRGSQPVDPEAALQPARKTDRQRESFGRRLIPR